MRALLVGKEPAAPLAYTYVTQPPYEAVVIGSLTLVQAMHFSCEEALQALAQGKPVVLYTPGLPEVSANRALSAYLAARYREMKTWGIRFVDGSQRRLITAQQAQSMRSAGVQPAPGAVLTPLAREILEGK